MLPIIVELVFSDLTISTPPVLRCQIRMLAPTSPNARCTAAAVLLSSVTSMPVSTANGNTPVAKILVSILARMPPIRFTVSSNSLHHIRA